MKRKHINSNSALVACGLTNGTIMIYFISKTEGDGEAKLELLLEDKNSHDFGVNCIDVKMIANGENVTLLVVSGGDD